MFVGERIKHKIFGEGEIINVIDRKSGYAAREQIVEVMFDEPYLTEFDKIRTPGTTGVSQRRFTPTSLKKFLV